MLLVTLEGLPHAGKCSVLRNLVALCPHWSAVNVAGTPSPTASWASASCRTGHALFASLMRKTHAISKSGNPGVVLLNSPWFEHLPRRAPLQSLCKAMTRELVACLGCKVDKHVMVMLKVPPDETFEQMVSCGSPYWNSTSLADVRTAERVIADHMARAQGLFSNHPFPCTSHTIECPPFFEENEVVALEIARRVVAVVERELVGVQKA